MSSNPTNNIVNQAPYLRTTRNFPQEAQPLVVEINRSYTDIAQKVNVRIIGLFPTNNPGITGEQWYLSGSGERQQSLREVYMFTSTAAINHNINPSSISRFVRCWGNFTDGTNWYGLFNASNVAIAGQITFYITPTQIIFLVGAGAPAITSGQIVLEWLSNTNFTKGV